TYPSHSVTLLEKLRAITPKVETSGWDFDRDDADGTLFTAYIQSGQWRGAEKMWSENFRVSEDHLGTIAVSASRAGDIKDAVRLWTIHANLDRRKLEG